MQDMSSHSENADKPAQIQEYFKIIKCRVYFQNRGLRQAMCVKLDKVKTNLSQTVLFIYNISSFCHSIEKCHKFNTARQ